VLLWLAWRIGTASRAKAEAGRARPLSFLQAAGFQWINPKAWMMAVSIPAAFVTGLHPAREAAICAGAFLLSGLGSSQAWAGFGAALRRWLADDRRLRLFNAAMGLSVAASAAYLAGAELR
jgi:threonine/homoserine/homoserine lactone efflux protein